MTFCWIVVSGSIDVGGVASGDNAEERVEINSMSSALTINDLEGFVELGAMTGDINLEGAVPNASVGGDITIGSDYAGTITIDWSGINRSFRGDIVINGDMTGDISLDNRLSGSITVDGDFTGTLTTDNRVDGWIDIGGDLKTPGQISITGDVVRTDIDEPPTIRVRGSVLRGTAPFGPVIEVLSASSDMQGSIAIDGSFQNAAPNDVEVVSRPFDSSAGLPFFTVDYDGWDANDSWPTVGGTGADSGGTFEIRPSAGASTLFTGNDPDERRSIVGRLDRRRRLCDRREQGRAAHRAVQPERPQQRARADRVG